MALIILLLLTLVLVPVGGHFVTKRWKQQELARRKKRAQAVAAAPAAAVVDQKELPERTLPLRNWYTPKPPVMAMSEEQAELLAAKLEAQMQVVLAKTEALRKAHEPWKKAVRNFQAYLYNVLSSSFSINPADIKSFESAVLLRRERWRELLEAQVLILNPPEFARLISQAAAGGQELKRLVKPVASLSPYTLPRRLVVVRRVVEELLLKQSNYLREDDIRTLPTQAKSQRKGMKETHREPDAPQSPELVDLAAKVKEQAVLVLSLLNEAAEVGSSCAGSKKRYLEAQEHVDSPLQLADAGSFEEMFIRKRGQKLEFLQAGWQFETEIKQFEAAIIRVGEAKNKFEALVNPLREHQSLTAELEAIKHVCSYASFTFQSGINDLSQALGSLKTVLLSSVEASEADDTKLAAILPGIKELLQAAVNACFALDGQIELVQEPWQKLLDFSYAGMTCPQKPAEKEVADCLSLFRERAAAEMSAAQIFCERVRSIEEEEARVKAVVESFENGMSALDDLDCQKKTTNVVTAVTVCNSFSAWLEAKLADLRHKIAPLTNHCVTFTKPAEDGGESDALAELQAKMRSFAFALAQREVAKNKCLKVQSGKRPSQPKAPTLPAATDECLCPPCDFVQLVAGMEAHLVKMEKYNGECEKNREDLALASRAFEERRQKAEECRKALKDFLQQRRRFRLEVSNQLSVLILAAGALSMAFSYKEHVPEL
ncbi:MAG: hypothetical protein K2W82_16675 [Candidatus Obscuribacterales bacterium]|nr:hypothetical protein [Candidatus Obscuribacterales bacterium]